MGVRSVYWLMSRAWVLLVLGLGCVLADARPALALGCHVDDRPTLGLSPADGLEKHSLQSASVGALEGSGVQVAPRPCEREDPASSTGLLTAPAVSHTEAIPRIPAPSSSLLLDLETPGERRSPCPGRVDRPPRFA
ncbi:MAG TPA: hypothetical protein VGZ22_11440 [Isosphaeraceae bacterium]|nr:hypothetical protein [Isosphaeraceae bacterium]